MLQIWPMFLNNFMKVSYLLYRFNPRTGGGLSQPRTGGGGVDFNPPVRSRELCNASRSGKRR